MRRSCEERRAAADPQQVLRGWRFWVPKVAALVFAVAALGMNIAGLAITPKELVVKVWTPVHHFSGYLNDTAATMDTMLMDLGKINPILDNLTVIANVDINFASLRSNLQIISNTLDQSSADPTTLSTQLTSLDSATTGVRAQLASLRTQLGSGGLGGTVTSLSGGIGSWKIAVSTFSGYGTTLSSLNTQFTLLNTAAGPVYDTTNLEAALSAADVASWQSTVGSMLASLDAWKSISSNKSFTALATQVTTLQTAIDDLKNNKVPATSSALTDFTNAWFGILPAIKNLLDRVDSIQANVVVLDASSAASLADVRTIYANLTAFQASNPSPALLASNLTALLPDLSLGPVAALTSALTTLQTALDGVPTATLDDARSAASSVKDALDVLAPQTAATTSSITTYKASPSATTFAALKTQAVGSGNTWGLSQTAQTASTTAAAKVSVLAVQTAVVTSGLDSQVSSLQANMTAVDSAAASVSSSLDAKVPPLAPYRSQVAGVETVYDSLPPPSPSAELNSVVSTLNRIENLVLTTPAGVRSQVASVNSSFRGGVDKLRSQVVVKIDNFERDNGDTLESGDRARYRATCVIFGLAGLCCLVLIVAVLLNWPWGIGCSIFFTLLLTILLFLLGVLFAAVLVGLQDGCYHTEHVVLSGVGSNSAAEPLLQYYFFGDNSTSVKTVLKDADIVDVDRVTSDVVNQADGIINNFTAQYTPRPKTQGVFDSIRGFISLVLADISAILDKASVYYVQPLYIELKSFPCCFIADYSAKTWAVLTFGGWLMLISANLAMNFLGLLDQLPQSGYCGCKPLLMSRLRGNEVHPEEERGGQAAPKGEEGAVKAVVLDAPGQQQMTPTGWAAGPNDASAPPYPNAYSNVDPYTGAQSPPAQVAGYEAPYGAPQPTGYGAPPPPYGNAPAYEAGNPPQYSNSGQQAYGNAPQYNSSELQAYGNEVPPPGYGAPPPAPYGTPPPPQYTPVPPPPQQNT